MRDTVGRGQDVVSRVKDSVSEAVRSRRDSVAVAHRRRQSAKRRLIVLSLIAAILTVFGVSQVLEIAQGELNVTSIGGAVLVTALWIYAVIATVQAAREWRIRSAVVRSLPPLQPERQSVDRVVRPLMLRLNEYSDALRQSIGAVGLDDDSGRHGAIRQLRNDTIAVADAAETRLRRQSSELTAMVRASRASHDERVTAACDQLRDDIAAGVDAYGGLVAAVVDATAASRALAATVDGDDDVAETTQRLLALSDGMRELADPSHAR